MGFAISGKIRFSDAIMLSISKQVHFEKSEYFVSARYIDFEIVRWRILTEHRWLQAQVGSEAV